jgi:hypothetical protein
VTPSSLPYFKFDKKLVNICVAHLNRRRNTPGHISDVGTNGAELFVSKMASARNSNKFGTEGSAGLAVSGA